MVLAADISGRGGRDAVTTLDGRIAATSDDIELTGATRDGSSWSGPGTAGLAWLRYSNSSEGTAVGYVLLDEQDVMVALDEVTNSRRVVRLNNPNTMITKRVFGASIAHPAGATSSVAFAIVPGASDSQLQEYGGGPLTVLANNRRVQAVKHTGLGLIAANVFVDGPQRAERLSIDGKASVIMQDGSDGTMSIAVSDPTMNRADLSLVIRGRTLEKVSADDGVHIDKMPSGTKITVNTHQAHGRSFTATLR